MSIYVLRFCIILWKIMYIVVCLFCINSSDHSSTFCINSSDHSSTINVCIDPQGRMISLFLGQKCFPVNRIEKPILSRRSLLHLCHFYKNQNFRISSLQIFIIGRLVVNETIKIMDMLLVMCRFRTVEQWQCDVYLRYAMPSQHNTTLPCW